MECCFAARIAFRIAVIPFRRFIADIFPTPISTDGFSFFEIRTSESSVKMIGMYSLGGVPFGYENDVCIETEYRRNNDSARKMPRGGAGHLEKLLNFLQRFFAEVIELNIHIVGADSPFSICAEWRAANASIGIGRNLHEIAAIILVDIQTNGY